MPFAAGVAITLAGCVAQPSVPSYVGTSAAGHEAHRRPDSSGYSILYNFSGATDASTPTGLVQVGSTFYGASNIGGRYGKGSIFVVTPTATGATEHVIYSFNSSKRAGGTYPISRLTVMKVAGGNGLYGTTYNGGANGGGTLYSVTGTGTERTIYSFPKTEQPIGALLAVGNRLYGTTQSDGISDSGTIFSTTAAGVSNVLYSFTFSGQGAGGDPSGFLSTHDGSLYGTTVIGGANQAGTMFELSQSGKMRVLYNVKSGTDAFAAQSPLLVEGNAGAETIYGVTHSGGVTNQGTVFSLNPSKHTVRLIYQFTGNADGGNPFGNIVIVGGVLYGAATDGGGGTCTVGSIEAGCGAIFSVNLASGQEQVLHAFTGQPDGSYPNGVILVNGALYGATEYGGSSGRGTVFRIGL